MKKHFTVLLVGGLEQEIIAEEVLRDPSGALIFLNPEGLSTKPNFRNTEYAIGGGQWRYFWEFTPQEQTNAQGGAGGGGGGYG